MDYWCERFYFTGLRIHQLSLFLKTLSDKLFSKSNIQLENFFFDKETPKRPQNAQKCQKSA
jgi:hypothetical protein